MLDEHFSNAGPLLSPEKLAVFKSQPEWECDTVAEDAKRLIAEAFEANKELFATNPTEPQTKFFAVNPTLHALGYVYSIGEDVPIQNDARAHVDFTLFPSGEEFAESEPMRGSTAFFRAAIGLVQAVAWAEDLSVSESAEVAARQPMVTTDLLLRSSGVNFGLVTNGSRWRLLHRATSETLGTYVEADLPKLIEAPLDEFKEFYLLFSKSSLQPSDEGVCFLDQFLAN
jgi:hypothetical protein